MRNDDPQCKRVYKFEDTWQRFGEQSLNRPHFRLAVRAACDYYGVPWPTVTFLPWSALGDGAWYDPNTHKIYLRKQRYCNMAVALHEAAHAIDTYLFGDKNETHGPVWLGIYFWLLVKMGEAPFAALAATAKRHRLKYRGLRASSPQRLRRFAKD